MEYERIHKVQTGIISPSKLRMKLIGPHHHKKKDGSNSNSARTSPSKLEDSEFVKNSLLASTNPDFGEEAPTVEVKPVKVPDESVPGPAQHDQLPVFTKDSTPREIEHLPRVRMHQFPKGDGSSTIHPLRIMEDENLDYDSNASSSSFEFHKAERAAGPYGGSRSLSRPMPSKWNDAEKWIMSKQHYSQPNGNYPRKNVLQNQTNRLPPNHNMGRVAPEFTGYNHKLPIDIRAAVDTKRVDFCKPVPNMGVERFSFAPEVQVCGGNGNAAMSSESKDLNVVVLADQPCIENPMEETSGILTVREVSMRDMGTEMTPGASQEPSRTSTPIGSVTPFRSPTSSVPSTPRRNEPAPTPLDPSADDESHHPIGCKKRELSEEEMKLKTRREIVALGVQLGKMNIAAWASKDEPEKNKASSGEGVTPEELERIEFEKRAAAWEEVEKSKHTARFKREEIKIQVWESQQKAKLEAELRRIEAQVDQMRAQAQAKMVRKIAMSRQRSEEKRAAAEARRNREAERTAAQAEYIRQTGKLPSSQYICCGWFS
ncbi:uncharacterized protein LOC116214262 isoform X2 [Punica granatum]|uniref:Uncharacterized protein LOC116214262 isoform X2 n=2 Tax=Punica granatum TaxID=22663 RepID=A0A6P8EFD3_PUNGR|nr:uncharacterized protein LOC116214262 isoform X2 [Punica granatum]